jgi:hypothetical protein
VSDIRQLPETGPDMNQAAFGVCFGPAVGPGLFLFPAVCLPGQAFLASGDQNV